MNKINELLQTLCPHGIEYKPLGELCNIYVGGSVPEDCLKGSKFSNEKPYPVFSNGLDENGLYGYSSTFRINDMAITFSSIGTIGHPRIRAAKFTPIVSLITIVPKKQTLINIYFLRYLLEVVQVDLNPSTLPFVSGSMIKKTLIPLPPLSIQKEIVRILDRFTSSTNKLITLLTDELSMRKKQYAYYRDLLLTFDLNHLAALPEQNKISKLIQTLCPHGIEYKPLGELCNIYVGGSVPEDCLKGSKFSNEKPYPVFSNGLDENGLYGYSSTFRINDMAITFSSIGTIGHPRIRAAKFTPIVSLITIVPKKQTLINIYFLRYLLEVVQVDLNPSTLPFVSGSMIKKTLIPLPPLSIQKEIVRILDRFDTYSNDLTKGLPLEIAMRQKQYAYYRDLLLTFKQKESI